MIYTNAMLAMTFWERTVYSGQMLLIGLGTVFAVLSLLWGALEIFRRLVPSREKPAVKSVQEAKAAPKGEDPALIAVITAAVAATLAAENGGQPTGFRVVSYRKAPGATDKH